MRRNIFNWKDTEVGKLEAKVKSFCAIPQVLAFLKDYIIFAEKDEELNKYILRQHQTGAVDATVGRALPSTAPVARLAHPGSGKTFTMSSAERFSARPSLYSTAPHESTQRVEPDAQTWPHSVWATWNTPTASSGSTSY